MTTNQIPCQNLLAISVLEVIASIVDLYYTKHNDYFFDINKNASQASLSCLS